MLCTIKEVGAGSVNRISVNQTHYWLVGKLAMIHVSKAEREVKPLQYEVRQAGWLVVGSGNRIGTCT